MTHDSAPTRIRQLTTKSIAQYYNVAEGTVRRWASQDQWQPYKTGNNRLWDVADAQRSHDRRRPTPILPAKPKTKTEDKTTTTTTTTAQCTVEKSSGKFCSRPSAPRTPFPICTYHIAQLYEFIKDRTDEPATVMDAMIDVLKSRTVADTDQKKIGVVYYLQVGDLIKIGTTVNLPQRLQNYPPNRRLLGTEQGGYELERQRHRQFCADRACGEWFHPSPRLLDHVRKLRQSRHRTTPA